MGRESRGSSRGGESVRAEGKQNRTVSVNETMASKGEWNDSQKELRVVSIDRIRIPRNSPCDRCGLHRDQSESMTIISYSNSSLILRQGIRRLGSTYKDAYG